MIQRILKSQIFRTGDTELDELLRDARAAYLSRNRALCREAVQKLWDAWERLKTIEPGKDKRASVTAMLHRASTRPLFREALEREAAELTRIGNSSHIRHSEVGQEALTATEYDYLFNRLFALIRLILLTTDRHGLRQAIHEGLSRNDKLIEAYVSVSEIEVDATRVRIVFYCDPPHFECYEFERPAWLVDGDYVSAKRFVEHIVNPTPDHYVRHFVSLDGS